ncbi:MAG: hypothetical protein ACREYF_19015 [Gammaproteobacteria bacterium]
MAEPPPVRDARLLAEETIRGGDKSPAAFARLIGLLLRLTVVKNPQGGRIIWQRACSGSRKATTVVISGWSKTNALIPLNNGGFLRLAMTLSMDEHDERGRFLKVAKSIYQYQLDEGDEWVFRYDYAREPGNEHPPSHLQIWGNLIAEGALPKTKPLEGVHFPSRRISLESVLRLLAVDFGIRTNKPADVWRAALAASEEPWLRVAREGNATR